MNGISVKISLTHVKSKPLFLFCNISLKKHICSLQCSYGCKPTPVGPRCYCPYGKKPEANKCVDADECEWDETCAQICENTPGSFKCSCVSGYQSVGTDCIAINCEYIFFNSFTT